MSTRACAPSARRFGASRARNLRCSSSSAPRVITGVYFIGCSVCSTPAKRVILTLPHALHRKYAPLKALACKKALYVNKALKNSLYSHKEPFCVGDERGKQGRGSGGKAAGGKAYFSTGNGYNRVPCPHRHVALTNITCAMPPQRRAHCTDRETHLHDT